MTPQRKKQLIIILAALLCVVVFDQVSKAVIRANVPYPDRALFQREEPVFFCFTHQHNPGLVGGIFRNNRTMAHLAPIFAAGVLVYLYIYLDKASKIQAIAYGMIGGGAIGNIIDRVRIGHVTDFLQFHFYFIPFNFPWKYYPAFNVADTGICTGVFVLIVSWHLMARREALAARAQEAPKPASGDAKPARGAKKQHASRSD